MNNSPAAARHPQIHTAAPGAAGRSREDMILMPDEFSDPIYPLAWQFPLGRPFGEVSPSDDPPSGTHVRPFGLLFVQDRVADVSINRSDIGYDVDRQIAVVHDGNGVTPLCRHTDGTTNTQTSDGHQGMDSDTDHRED